MKSSDRIAHYIDELSHEPPPDTTLRVMCRISVAHFYRLQKLIEHLNDPQTFGSGLTRSACASDLLEFAIEDAYEYCALPAEFTRTEEFREFIIKHMDAAETEAARERMAAAVERQVRQTLAGSDEQ